MPATTTMEVQRQTMPATTSDLELLQLGFDRTCASCPARSLVPFPVQSPESIPLPGAAGHLVRTSMRRRRPRGRYPWTRTATYVHRPTGHNVRLFYGRSKRAAPPLFVTLWPVAGQVFSLPTLRLLLDALSGALKLPLMFSSLEIAADFAAPPHDVPRVASRLWVPRQPGHLRVGAPDTATIYRGSRASACQVKVYAKDEGALHALRLEFTFRRRALRKLHLDAPDSLEGVDWGLVCSRRARLVTVLTDTQRNTALSIAAREAFGSGGIFAVQDRLGTPGMRWLSRHIVSSQMQHTLETALSALGHLPAATPVDTEPADFVDPDTVTADGSLNGGTRLSPEGRNTTSAVDTCPPTRIHDHREIHRSERPDDHPSPSSHAVLRRGYRSRWRTSEACRQRAGRWGIRGAALRRAHSPPRGLGAGHAAGGSWVSGIGALDRRARTRPPKPLDCEDVSLSRPSLPSGPASGSGTRRKFAAPQSCPTWSSSRARWRARASPVGPGERSRPIDQWWCSVMVRVVGRPLGPIRPQEPTLPGRRGRLPELP